MCALNPRPTDRQSSFYLSPSTGGVKQRFDPSVRPSVRLSLCPVPLYSSAVEFFYHCRCVLVTYAFHAKQLASTCTMAILQQIETARGQLK